MERRVVYDSDAVQAGRCPTCGKRLDRCTCDQALPGRARSQPTAKPLNLPRDGVVRLLRDRKGRSGKGVTLIAGVNGSPAALETLTRELRHGNVIDSTVFISFQSIKFRHEDSGDEDDRRVLKARVLMDHIREITFCSMPISLCRLLPSISMLGNWP